MTVNAVNKIRSMIQQPQAPQQPTVVSVESAEDDRIASLEEKLSTFYAEMEHLHQSFPNQSVRSVVDLALSLQSRLESGSGSGGSIGFVPAEIAQRLATLDQATADACDFGIVETDDTGCIRMYNRWEQALAGITQDQAIGRNFFSDVAPCTNNRLFLGRFRQGVQTGMLDVASNYTFTYKIKPTAVAIHMYRYAASQRNNVFVMRC